MRLWSPIAAVLSVAGFFVSLYLTLEHYQKVSLVCPSFGQTFNCGAVLSSSNSTVLGIPTAALGLLWFAVMFGLALSGRRETARPPLRAPVLAWSGLGVAAVLYLVYVELFVVGAFCLWCSVAHLLILALFAMNSLVFWDL